MQSFGIMHALLQAVHPDALAGLDIHLSFAGQAQDVGCGMQVQGRPALPLAGPRMRTQRALASTRRPALPCPTPQAGLQTTTTWQRLAAHRRRVLPVLEQRLPAFPN